MGASDVITELPIDAEHGSGLDAVRTALDRHRWVAMFVLAELLLLGVGFGLDALGGEPAGSPGVLNVVAGLLGAYAVLLGGLGAVGMAVWGGYRLLRSHERSAAEELA